MMLGCENADDSWVVGAGCDDISQSAIGANTPNFNDVTLND